MPDAELDAMSVVTDVLAPLDQEARDRVLRWATAKFGGVVHGASSPGHLVPVDHARDFPNESTVSWAPQYATFGELFHSAQPLSEKEKALLAAYWVQSVGGADSFVSQTLNSQLKDLGYAVSNITAALSQLQEEKPALVVQLRKSGTSQQARKIYKLTDAGRRRVEEKLRGGGSNA